MSDSANDLESPRYDDAWGALPPGQPGEASPGDQGMAGVREDDPPASYFHSRWLGEDG